jgi:type II secretion system protein G
MNKTLIILSLVLLASCGPTPKEKEEIASITCNIMGNTRNMDSAVRIREINAAREKIGEEPFLSSDKKIKKAFEAGLCQELVLNDPEYDEKLSERLLAISRVGKVENPKIAKDTQDIVTALKFYRLDNYRYPTETQGLEALITAPNGPYIHEFPKDPWGKDYQYRNPGVSGEQIDVYTLDASGKELGQWNTY